MDQEKEPVAPARFLGAYEARGKTQLKVQSNLQELMEKARTTIYNAIDEAIEKGESLATIELRHFRPEHTLPIMWAAQELLPYNYLIECAYLNSDYELRISW